LEDVIRTTQERSERYEHERIDASARHKRKLEQMRESQDHDGQSSQVRLEEAASASALLQVAEPAI
jgi:hypothetical protein